MRDECCADFDCYTHTFDKEKPDRTIGIERIFCKYIIAIYYLISFLINDKKIVTSRASVNCKIYEISEDERKKRKK